MAAALTTPAGESSTRRCVSDERIGCAGRRRAWRRSAASGWCFRDLTFAVPAGGALVLAGPNGSGKSHAAAAARRAGAAGGRAVAVGRRGCAGRPGRAWPARVAYRRPSGRGEAGADGGRKPAVRRGVAGRAVARGAGGGRAGARWPICRRGCCRPGRSGGWRWRGWRCRPAPLWLLDEPTLGLDAASVERFGALLAAHRGSGGHGGGGDAPAAAAARTRRSCGWP